MLLCFRKFVLLVPIEKLNNNIVSLGRHESLEDKLYIMHEKKVLLCLSLVNILSSVPWKTIMVPYHQI